MTKLKLSYSLLKAFKNTDKSKVVDLYLHIDNFENRYTKRGKEFDKYVEGFVKENKALPPELGGEKISDPYPKLKAYIPYNDQIDLSFEMDIYSNPFVYEIKCSEAQTSADFDDFQVEFYLFITEVAKDEKLKKLFEGTKGGYVYRFDPIHKVYDRSIIWKNKRVIDNVRKEIDENGPLIYKFLQEQGVL